MTPMGLNGLPWAAVGLIVGTIGGGLGVGLSVAHYAPATWWGLPLAVVPGLVGAVVLGPFLAAAGGLVDMVTEERSP